MLVFAAHPDDEVLGMGATIKKLTKKGNKVDLCVVSEGASAQYKDKKMIKVRKEACINSSKILGINSIEFLDFPDMKLDTIPHLELNKSIEKIINKKKPVTVFTIESDLNKDHQTVFNSVLIATRPYQNSVKRIFAYEIPGMHKKPFIPTTYHEISKEFPSKIKAFKNYKSEIMKIPHPRSIEALESLATIRGMESGFKKAEAFNLIRESIN